MQAAQIIAKICLILAFHLSNSLVAKSSPAKFVSASYSSQDSLTGEAETMKSLLSKIAILYREFNSLEKNFTQIKIVKEPGTIYSNINPIIIVRDITLNVGDIVTLTSKQDSLVQIKYEHSSIWIPDHCTEYLSPHWTSILGAKKTANIDLVSMMQNQFKRMTLAYKSLSKNNKLNTLPKFTEIKRYYILANNIMDKIPEIEQTNETISAKSISMERFKLLAHVAFGSSSYISLGNNGFKNSSVSGNTDINLTVHYQIDNTSGSQISFNSLKQSSYTTYHQTGFSAGYNKIYKGHQLRSSILFGSYKHTLFPEQSSDNSTINLAVFKSNRHKLYYGIDINKSNQNYNVDSLTLSQFNIKSFIGADVGNSELSASFDYSNSESGIKFHNYDMLSPTLKLESKIKYGKISNLIFAQFRTFVNNENFNNTRLGFRSLHSINKEGSRIIHDISLIHRFYKTFSKRNYFDFQYNRQKRNTNSTSNSIFGTRIRYNPKTDNHSFAEINYIAYSGLKWRKCLSLNARTHLPDSNSQMNRIDGVLKIGPKFRYLSLTPILTFNLFYDTKINNSPTYSSSGSNYGLGLDVNSRAQIFGATVSVSANFTQRILYSVNPDYLNDEDPLTLSRNPSNMSVFAKIEYPIKSYLIMFMSYRVFKHSTGYKDSELEGLIDYNQNKFFQFGVKII